MISIGCDKSNNDAVIHDGTAEDNQGMNDLNSVKNTTANVDTRSDLDGKEYRSSSFYKPISTHQYFKVLGYCLFVFVVVVFLIILFFV